VKIQNENHIPGVKPIDIFNYKSCKELSVDLLIRGGWLALAYFIGSIPFGYILIRMKTGQDIRDFHSGRSGGTNVMRVSNVWTGLVAGVLDTLKGASSVWIARALFPDASLIHVLSPIATIIGHNYSVLLVTRREDGKLIYGGGAGGSTCLGGMFGLWFPSGVIGALIGIALWYFVGYASVTTLSFAFSAIVIFTIRAVMGLSPWEYVLYGIVAQILLVWALRPNIQRLKEGTERLHGFRAGKKKKVIEAK
jgi:glycerol-3-phosphate acyltransferase PlsY